MDHKNSLKNTYLELQYKLSSHEHRFKDKTNPSVLFGYLSYHMCTFTIEVFKMIYALPVAKIMVIFLKHKK